MPKRRKSGPAKIQQPVASSKKKQKSQSRVIRQFEAIGAAKGLKGPKLANFVRVQMEKESKAKQAPKRVKKRRK
jgi:hypothetical protein